MSQRYEKAVRAWLDNFVLELNLCPFARPVIAADTLRIAVCQEQDIPSLRHYYLRELDLLQNSSELELATTLVVYPRALTEFEEYLEFLQDAQELLEAAGLDGILQLASFHPQYRFAGEPAAAPGNYSNRAPYPVIHLLRESMITRALADFPAVDQIPANNIETLNRIGITVLQQRWQALSCTD